jgi:hypothetical protein
VAQRALAFGGARREGFGIAGGEGGAIGNQRACEAIGRAGAADGRAQIHHRLGKIAVAVRRGHRVGKFADSRPRLG